jgi:hypothetical protein
LGHHERELKITAFAGLALACLSLGACNTLGGLDRKPMAATRRRCSTTWTGSTRRPRSTARGTAGILAWNPPLPPTGSLNIDCYIGQNSRSPRRAGTSAARATGGFGDGSSVILTLSEFQALLQSAKSGCGCTQSAPAQPPKP